MAPFDDGFYVTSVWGFMSWKLLFLPFLYSIGAVGDSSLRTLDIKLRSSLIGST